MRRPMTFVGIATAAVLALAACGSSGGGGAADTTAAPGTTAAAGSSTPAGTQPATTGGGASLDGTTLTVGSANFPENVLLAEIYAQALEGKGAKVSRKLNVGAREVLFKALTDGEIQLTPEYTNSLLSFVLKAKGQTPTAKNVDEQVTALKAALPANLTVLAPSKAEDKDVIVCNKATADKYDLKSLSDLAKSGSNITLGAAPEFAQRSPFGIPGLKATYGITFKAFKPLEIGQPVIDALKANAIQCGNLFSTDPAITANEFVTLEDDKVIVPNEAVLPLIAKDKVTSDLQGVLDGVSAKLDTPGLTALVAKVITNAQDPAKVAGDWLKDNGFTS